MDTKRNFFNHSFEPQSEIGLETARPFIRRFKLTKRFLSSALIYCNCNLKCRNVNDILYVMCFK